MEGGARTGGAVDEGDGRHAEGDGDCAQLRGVERHVRLHVHGGGQRGGREGGREGGGGGGGRVRRLGSHSSSAGGVDVCVGDGSAVRVAEGGDVGVAGEEHRQDRRRGVRSVPQQRGQPAERRAVAV
jgi:hypothetical protein